MVEEADDQEDSFASEAVDIALKYDPRSSH